jgi:hypothetical protein
VVVLVVLVAVVVLAVVVLVAVVLVAVVMVVVLMVVARLGLKALVVGQGMETATLEILATAVETTTGPARVPAMTARTMVKAHRRPRQARRQEAEAPITDR